MACDVRIASDKAKFGQPEINLGIIPGCAGTQRLPRLVGKGQAKLLILTGDIIDAQEASRIGLVDKVVPQAELLNTAKKLAARIVSKAPYALRQAKRAINHGIEIDSITGATFEAECFGMCFTTSDRKEGMHAYVEKRKPSFTGH
jgi:enoyl-CoA hydratase